ncbi:hypothetical protein GWK47_038204 [Chionoecetes opilio]|uniref:Uncharacterized protein n=1 Tax=Chionoecetes opilio TaxID=41210 RepID=A0A8J4YFL1_CHIOP|nr:hypothetical protein GWK47_038204 [Chionoecetes opilio]
MSTRFFLKGVFEPASALPLVLTLGTSKDSLIDGPSWIPRRERRWKNRRTPVEFFAPMGRQQAEGRRIAFLKGGSDVENHPREDYEDFSVSPTCFSGVKVPPKTLPPAWALNRPGGWGPKGPTASNSMLKPAALTGQRRPDGKEWPFPLLCVLGSNGMRHRPFWKTPLNDVLFLEIPQNIP